MKFFTKLSGDDRGAGLVEYGMIVSIISLLSFSAVQLLGHSTEDTFTEVAQAVDHEATSGSGNGGAVESADVSSGGSGGSGATTSTTAPATTSTTAGPATTTTTTQATTTTTAAVTTTTTTPATTSTTAPAATTTTTTGDDGSGGSDSGDGNGSEGSDDSGSAPAPGSQSTPTDTSSDFTWWNNTNNGGNGEWKASVTFSNDWIRHQYLELEVTQIDHKGRTTTKIINGFYVPAGGTTTFDHWGNVLKDNKGRVTGVMQVEVKVLEVRTSDVDWQPTTYPQSGESTVVTAPKVP